MLVSRFRWNKKIYSPFHVRPKMKRPCLVKYLDISYIEMRYILNIYVLWPSEYWRSVLAAVCQILCPFLGHYIGRVVFLKCTVFLNYLMFAHLYLYLTTTINNANRILISRWFFVQVTSAHQENISRVVNVGAARPVHTVPYQVVCRR